MRRVTFISLALFFLLLSAAETSFACSCERNFKPLKWQVKDAYVNSTAVFSGEVVEIKPSPTNPDMLAVKIKVGNSWKGKLAEEITITTAKDSAMCGYGFEVGQSYLVYAFGANDDLMTTNCSRTKLSSYKQDIRFLNKLKRRKVKSS